MKLSWLVIPGILLVACNQKSQKNADTNGAGAPISKESSEIKAAAEAAKLAETKAPEVAESVAVEEVKEVPADLPEVEALAPEPAVKEISAEEALKHIAPGLVDFACKKANPTTVACKPVDSKRKNLNLPNEAKVEWFASDGTEESMKAVKAELKNDPAAGATWSIPLDEFLSKAVLARVTRDRAQADIYVTPDD